MTDAEIIDAILVREGGWVDHPADRGGPTNWGITLPTLRESVSTATIDDLRALPRDAAGMILRGIYLVKPGFDKIEDDALRALLVDCAVNHGPGRAVRLLQAGLGVKEDGVIGADTRAAMEKISVPALILRICAARIRFYGKLIASDHSQASFAGGWLNRATEFLDDLVKRHIE